MYRLCLYNGLETFPICWSNRQLSLSDEFPRFFYSIISTLTFYLLDFIPCQEYSDQLFEAVNLVLSVLDLENIKLSIEKCFDLNNNGVKSTKPLRLNKTMKYLQNKLLKNMYESNVGSTKTGSISYFLKYKERWFDTIRDKKLLIRRFKWINLQNFHNWQTNISIVLLVQWYGSMAILDPFIASEIEYNRKNVNINSSYFNVCISNLG